MTPYGIEFTKQVYETLNSLIGVLSSLRDELRATRLQIKETNEKLEDIAKEIKKQKGNK